MESPIVVPDGLWGRSYSDIHVSSVGKWMRAFLEVGNIGKRRKMMGSALDHGV